MSASLRAQKSRTRSGQNRKFGASEGINSHLLSHLNHCKQTLLEIWKTKMCDNLYDKMCDNSLDGIVRSLLKDSNSL